MAGQDCDIETNARLIQRSTSSLVRIYHSLDFMQNHGNRKEGKEIDEVRDDQLKAAEKKLEQLSHHRVQIEAHIQELTGTKDKRRDRLGELEHKLVELHTDITEAERLRSELRQQADLAHTELKNFETAIDRLAKKTTD